MTPEEQEILNRAEEIGKRYLASLSQNDPKTIATLNYLAGREEGIEEGIRRQKQMTGRSITEFLNTHHDKLNQHTAEIKDIQHDIEVLQQSVSALEAKVAKTDESSGVRAGLREWISSIKELM
jgi:peptidoglycan hydrolase CwlO-like protein